MPFAHINKSQHVFTMSHTCTERPRGRCGVCWQCKERQWGFKENNLKDPGKI